ncbi:MAG: hypothetical protein HGA70_00030 [Chlorobiaceae bacterium]|nr:hypothetical protein [Chlorobiaceae bacterium]
MQVDPVIVKSIVPVERRVDGSGASELSVPETSVFHRGALTGVYVVGSDGRAVIRWINPGRSRDGDVVVLGGLDEGEKIVGSASSQLEEGVPVKEQVTETEERKTNE